MKYRVSSRQRSFSSVREDVPMADISRELERLSHEAQVADQPTLAAAVPPALALGPGAESRIPMAITVIGGVIVSTFFTLLVVPCAYSLMVKLESKSHPEAELYNATTKPAMRPGHETDAPSNGNSTKTLTTTK